MNKNNCIDEDTSRAITGVRFFLILLVVFIHDVLTKVNFADETVLLEVPLAVDIAQHFIGSILGRVTVPLFYFFAVFLFFNSNALYGGIRTALFYFSLGGFAVRFNLTYKNLERIKLSDAILLFALTVIIDFVFYFTKKTPPDNKNLVIIISGGILFLKLSGMACKNQSAYRVLKYLAGFSFWLYATHEPFLITPLKKLWTKFIPVNDCWLFAKYFGAVILCVLISLSLALLLKKLCPKLFALLTGSRQTA